MRPSSAVAQGSIVGLLLPREPTFWPLLGQLHADRERRVSLEVRPPSDARVSPVSARRNGEATDNQHRREPG
jgi:hypothetical protein